MLRPLATLSLGFLLLACTSGDDSAGEGLPGASGSAPQEEGGSSGSSGQGGVGGKPGGAGGNGGSAGNTAGQGGVAGQAGAGQGGAGQGGAGQAGAGQGGAGEGGASGSTGGTGPANDLCPGKPLGVAVQRTTGVAFNAELTLGENPPFNAASGSSTALSFGLNPGETDADVQLVIPASYSTSGKGVSRLFFAEFPTFCTAIYYGAFSPSRCDLALGAVDPSTGDQTILTSGVPAVSGVEIAVNDPQRASAPAFHGIHLTTGVFYLNVLMLPRVCPNGALTRMLIEWIGL